MGLSKALALALILSANTSQAAKAINDFADGAGKRLDKLSNHLKRKGGANIRDGLFITAPIMGAVKVAAELEDKVADIAKVTDVDFGSQKFKDLEQSVKNTAHYLGVMPDQTAQLMSELAAGGVTLERLDAVARSAGKIGVAFDVAAGEAGKAFMVIKNALNLAEKDTMLVMDAMNAATNKFGGKASELLNFMAQGGASVSQTLKISGVNMQAFANAMQVVGINSAEAATTMERFQKAVLTNAKAAQIFNKAGGGSKGIVAILEQAKASGNAAKWLLDRGFGEYSTKLAQMANNLDGEKGARAQLEFLSKRENVEGSASREFDNRQKTSLTNYNKFKVQATNISATLGATLLPVLTQLMKALEPILNRIAEWIERNPELTANILKVIGVLGVLKMAIGGVQSALGFAIAAASPATLILMAIAFVAYMIIKHWSKIADFFRRLWNNVKRIFKAAWEWISYIFMEYTPFGLIIKHWEVISKFFSDLWDGVKETFMSAINWIKEKWEWLNEKVIQPVKRFIGGVVNVTEAAVMEAQIKAEQLPQPVPVSNSSSTMSYNPVFNVQGAMTKGVANKIIAQGRRDFASAFEDYKQSQSRLIGN